MKISYFFLIALFLTYCGSSIAQRLNIPKEGCLVFIGQDLDAVGGLDEYIDGYVNHFPTPSGVTVYTNLSPGNNSFGYINKGLDGLSTKANWGAGDSWGQAYLDDSTFDNCAMSIGLSFVNNERKVAYGHHDTLIYQLATWIKKANRPILLRIGYEFDGHQWNHYRGKDYVKAWKRIAKILETEKVDNVSLVWQSKGYGSSQKTLEKWYPGDDLVDWVGYSYFGNPDTEMLTFARKHNKPVFIAEATPVRQIDNLYFNANLGDSVVSGLLWEEWFVPFFELIEANHDVIKAFSYINADWARQPMWENNPTFKKVDSRLHLDSMIKERWLKKMNETYYLNAKDGIKIN